MFVICLKMQTLVQFMAIFPMVVPTGDLKDKNFLYATSLIMDLGAICHVNLSMNCIKMLNRGSFYFPNCHFKIGG